MCIPNQLLVPIFPGFVCPSDNLQHFTVNFLGIPGNDNPLIDQQIVTDKAYEAQVHFNYNEGGEVISIDVLLISPMPDVDPDEPIPYRITEKGKEALEEHWLVNKKLFDSIFPTTV